MALFHVVGVTPEAPTLHAVSGGEDLPRVVATGQHMRDALARLSTAREAERIDAVAVGSPHFSLEEFEALHAALGGRRLGVPFYACTARATLRELEERGLADDLVASGVDIVADTCVVVTPILPHAGGVLMTNSGKFAHYGPSNTGYDVLYGSLVECVESAVTGAVVRDEALWTW